MSQRHSELASPAVEASERLFTPSFLLASLVTLASFSSFYFLLATLPIYVVREINGSESEVGLLMGAFSAVAVLLRPFVGNIADKRGKKSLIVAGTLGLTVCSGLYALAATVPILLGLRLLHAVGWASFGTSTNTLIADLAPRNRRGAAMGYFGMFSNLAMALGPALGLMLMNQTGFKTLFAVSAGIAFLAVLLALPLKEPARQGPPPGMHEQSRGGIIERTALFPALVLTLTTITYGSIVSFLPLYATKNGIDNPGPFFTVYAITLILARGFTGQISDRRGRGFVIVPGLMLAAAGLWLLSVSATMPMFLLVAVMYGLAFASVQPTLMALVVDRAPAGRRGAAMGTFSSAMDLGIGIGSVLWGIVAQVAGYHTMYLASGFVALAALGVFLAGTRSKRTEAAG